MTEISAHLYQVVILIFYSHLVNSYESVYDHTQRRNYERDDPNNRFYESSERYYNRDRYSTHNTSPTSIYASIRPTDDYISRRPVSNAYGNGYDNLGNGYQARPFRDRQRFGEEPRFGLKSRSRFDEPKRFDLFVTKDRTSDTFRNGEHGDPFTKNRQFDSFHGGESLDDRSRDSFLRRADTFRDDGLTPDFFRRTSADRMESFREPIRYDTQQDNSHGPFDLSREGSRIGGQQGTYQPLHREFKRYDEPRPLDSLSHLDVRTYDDHPSTINSRFNGGINRDSHWHSYDPPAFYRKDYFVPTHAKSSGYAGSQADNNYQENGGGKENSGVSTIGSYITSNEDKNQKKAESGYQTNKEGTKLDVENKEKTGETSRFDKNGGNKSTARSNKVHKKGHATKGFATHHHKDETGNTTTFFDESSDDGGQSDYQDVEDEFGSRRTSEVLNGKEDGKFFQQKIGKDGNFGSGTFKDNKKVEKDIVANDNRFNNEEKYGRGQDQVDKGYKTASEYIGGGVWQDSHPH